MIGGAYLST